MNWLRLVVAFLLWTPLLYLTHVTGAAGLLGYLVISCVLLRLSWLYADALCPPRLLPDLATRPVLITGCDSGFGRQLALRLSQLGVPVWAGCLRATSLLDEAGPSLRVLQMDVTQQQQVDKAIEQIQEAGSGLWAVVNNAGALDVGELELCPLSLLDHLLTVNTLGVVRVTTACLPLIRAFKGRVVIISSPLGRLPAPLLGPYSISKSAVRSFADILRLEMIKWDVSVQIIEPTSYETNLNNYRTFNRQLMENFKKSSEEARQSYGEAYVAECTRRLCGLSQMTKSNSRIGEVVDEMVKATIGSEPMTLHIPGLLEKLIYTIIPMLPTSLVDLVFYICLQPVLSFAKWKAGKEKNNAFHHNDYISCREEKFSDQKLF